MKKYILLSLLTTFCLLQDYDGQACYAMPPIETIANRPETKPTLLTYLNTLNLSNTFYEYIFQPIKNSFAEKNVQSLEIATLAQLLNARITPLMNDFIKLGKEAKELQFEMRLVIGDKEHKLQDLAEIHSKMADILTILKPVDPMVRSMYPKLTKLFDQLINLNEELDYSLVSVKEEDGTK